MRTLRMARACGGEVPLLDPLATTSSYEGAASAAPLDAPQPPGGADRPPRVADAEVEVAADAWKRGGLSSGSSVSDMVRSCTRMRSQASLRDRLQDEKQGNEWQSRATHQRRWFGALQRADGHIGRKAARLCSGHRRRCGNGRRRSRRRGRRRCRLVYRRCAQFRMIRRRRGRGRNGAVVLSMSALPVSRVSASRFTRGVAQRSRRRGRSARDRPVAAQQRACCAERRVMQLRNSMQGLRLMRKR
jgi:hypothetical protein